MNAIREIVKTKDKKIIINLNEDFMDDEYEVIILPVKKDMKKLSRQDFYGRYKATIEMSDDFNEPLEDFKEYME